MPPKGKDQAGPGDYYATFVTGTEEFYCSALEKGSDEVNQLIDASSGQSFEITGRIKSVWFDNVELDRCRLR